jgi:heme oxygenase
MNFSSSHTLSFHQRLKTLTHPFHDELEATELAKSLANATIELDDYANYLHKMHQLHNEIEKKLQSFKEFSHYSIDTSKRSRSDFLKKDLKSLNANNKEVSSFNLEIEWSFPVAIGVMYVLEGSTMGGQILKERLKKLPVENAHTITNYFDGYGAQTMKLWQEYSLFLEKYVQENPHDSSKIILGACAMFLKMQELMHARS